MKLVIEIDKDKNDRLDYLDVITLKEIIRNGKPLEKEPCEDAVSRKAVIDALCNGCELFHRNGEQTCLSKCEEYHFLVTLPPVNPTQNISIQITEREKYGRFN